MPIPRRRCCLTTATSARASNRQCRRRTSNDSEEDDIAAALAKLPAADRAIAIAQKFCVVLEENRLGSMGPPVKVMIDGKPVFLCCAGCKKKALADPKATLAKAAKLKAETEKR